MAELKNMVMGLLAMLFIASGVVSIYSYALTNNLNNGGSGASVPFGLANQTAGYTEQMETYANQLTNATDQAATTPTASLSTLGGGVGAITQSGTAAVSLSFSSISILIGMIASAGTTLVPLGVPPIVFAFGTLSIVIGITFAILAAVFKWWI